MGINKDGFDELNRRVKITLEQFIRQCCEKVRVDAKEIIRTNKAIGSGQMEKNITSDILVTASQIVGVVGVNANVPYGIFRHEGTRPHFPPLEPIKKWIVQKGIIRDANNKPTTMRRSKLDGQDQQITRVAFLIARKIAKRGTTGLAFLRIALNQNIGFIQSKLAEVKI